MHKNWNAIVEFSVRKKFLLSRKIIIMQKVFFVLVLELDGFFQKFCIVPLSKISQNPFICLKWYMFANCYKRNITWCVSKDGVWYDNLLTR